MELKEGMYVRTKDGIEKIKLIDGNFMDGDTAFIATDNDEFRGAYNGEFNGFTTRNDIIIKASYNIIDLIEPGDYVNGYRVDEIGEYHSIKTDKVETYARVNCLALLNCFYEEDIKSIVTKEEFEIMKYEVNK